MHPQILVSYYMHDELILTTMNYVVFQVSHQNLSKARSNSKDSRKSDVCHSIDYSAMNRKHVGIVRYAVKKAGSSVASLMFNCAGPFV